MKETSSPSRATKATGRFSRAGLPNDGKFTRVGAARSAGQRHAVLAQDLHGDAGERHPALIERTKTSLLPSVFFLRAGRYR